MTQRMTAIVRGITKTMNLREWAQVHLEKPLDYTVLDIITGELRPVAIQVSKTLDCSVYRAGRIIQAAQREGYRF